MKPQSGAGALAITGKLQDLHPARLYYSFFKAKKTGTLTFSASGPDLVVPLMQGVPVCIPGKLEDDRDMLDSLVAGGLVERGELNGALAWARTNRVTGVQAVIRRTGTTYEQWAAHAHRVFYQRLKESFRWRTGQYRFVDTGVDAPWDRPSPARIVRLVLDGVREYYNQQTIQQNLASRMGRNLLPYRKSLFRQTRLRLTETEKAVYKAALKGKTVGEILSSQDLSPTEASAALYGMLVLELFKLEKPAARRADVPSEREESRTQALIAEALRAVDKYEIVRPKGPSATEALQEHFRDKPPGPTRPAPAAPPPIEREPDRKPEPEPATPAATHVEEVAELDVFADESDDEPEVDVFGDGTDAVDELDVFGDETAGIDERELLEEEDSHASRVEEPLDVVETPPAGPAVQPPDEEGGDFRVDRISMDEKEVPRRRIAFDEDEDPERLFRIGLTYLDQGQYREARAALEQAIEGGHDFPEVHAYLGWTVYNDPGQKEPAAAARELLSRTVAADEDYFFPHLVLGRVARDEREFAAARDHFETALRLEPECREARDELRKLKRR